MVKTIAITGGIGSGKSEFRKAIAAAGYTCVSADELARDVLLDSKVTDALRVAFGSDIFDAGGQLLREKLRDVVFHDPGKKKTLESITHPAIARLFAEKREALARSSPGAWLFYEIPLLFETNKQSEFDVIIVVTADEQSRITRLKESRQLPEEVIRKIMAAQVPEADKIRQAHIVVNNSGNLHDLQNQVAKVQTFLRNKFAASSS